MDGAIPAPCGFPQFPCVQRNIIGTNLVDKSKLPNQSEDETFLITLIHQAAPQFVDAGANARKLFLGSPYLLGTEASAGKKLDARGPMILIFSRFTRNP